MTGTGTRIDGGEADRGRRISALGSRCLRLQGAGYRRERPLGHAGLIDVHFTWVRSEPGVDAQNDAKNQPTRDRKCLGRAQRLAPGPGLRVCHPCGITSLQVLQARQLIGGRGATLKNVPATTYQDEISGAPQGLQDGLW